MARKFKAPGRDKFVALLEPEIKELNRLLESLKNEDSDLDLWTYIDDLEAIGHYIGDAARKFYIEDIACEEE